MTSDYIYALCREVTGHHITAFLGNSEYSWFIWKSQSPRHPCTHFNKLFWIDMCQLPFMLWHRGISNVESFSVYVTFSNVLQNPYSVILALTLVIFVSLFFCHLLRILYLYFLIHHHFNDSKHKYCACKTCNPFGILKVKVKF